MPALSVLIPFYNREGYLPEALASIEAQTFTDWQVFLYDDGSTDRSYKIAEEFVKRHPKSCLWNSDRNHGVGYARNFLMSKLDTLYACWMDSDDLCDPTRLEKQMQAITYKDIVFTYAKFFRELSDLEIRGTYTIDVTKYDSRESLYENMIHASAFFRKELAKFKYQENIDRKEDVQWLVDLIEAKVRFGCVEEPLYWIRQHEERLTPNR